MFVLKIFTQAKLIMKIVLFTRTIIIHVIRELAWPQPWYSIDRAYGSFQTPHISIYSLDDFVITYHTRISISITTTPKFLSHPHIKLPNNYLRIEFRKEFSLNQPQPLKQLWIRRRIQSNG